ncbi:MAG: hypothetical protein HY562_05875 [Ignavibacteriales bacterium]|nr:hypothetical protein [Ignavibacteriales bacterium]
MPKLLAQIKSKVSELIIPGLPVRRLAPAKTKLGRWFFQGGRMDEESTRRHGTHPWFKVLWLTGVDYFSTLGYQPGIALIAAGAISPAATGVLVLVTLLGALPVYAQVAGRSFAGQGSIAMLENLLSGWTSKIFVLVLLGFAATDFVITMTLSAADAAQHAIENPFLHPLVGEARMGLTVGMLAVLAIVFLAGFSEAIGLAVLVAIPYLILNLVALGAGLNEILENPSLIKQWNLDLSLHGDWTSLLIVSALVFPKLALGMSGFETGVTVMPLVAGEENDKKEQVPSGRIRATRKLLASAAVIMAIMLVLSSFVTTLLISEEDYRIGGPASGRAISYLAHSILGEVFGTLYDVSTIAILWFAGASAMAGLLNLIPRYLPRYGMAPRWVAFRRPLVTVLFVITAVVTWAFEASVEAQGGAYATGVLVLMLSASVAVALSLWREFRSAHSASAWKLIPCGYFWLISAVFVFTLIDNVIERPDGVIIATIFIIVTMVASALSRYRRATELRVSEVTFVDEKSARLWRFITKRKVHLVPLSTSRTDSRPRKARELREDYKVRGPFAFIHVHLMDNRSEFLAPLRVRVFKENSHYVIVVWGAVAIANTIAYISELIDPKSIFLELTRENLMTQSFRYLFWGEGEVGLTVYTILIRYWEWLGGDEIRPRIYLKSE